MFSLLTVEHRVEIRACGRQNNPVCREVGDASSEGDITKLKRKSNKQIRMKIIYCLIKDARVQRFKAKHHALLLWQKGHERIILFRRF